MQNLRKFLFAIKSNLNKKNIFIFSGTLLFLFAVSFLNTDWKNKILNAATTINGYLSSTSTTAFITSATGVSSLTSTGFVLGTNALFNTNSNSYVAWGWKEDATSGFDIVTYTGTGANRTVSHALGATPAFMMFKRMDASGAWAVWHKELTSTTTGYIVLNTQTSQRSGQEICHLPRPHRLYH
jgi:hypothetical protein